MDLGLVDSPSSPMGSSDRITNQNRGSSFGKDIAENVEFNEEQEGQLGKLREEAAKAK